MPLLVEEMCLTGAVDLKATAKALESSEIIRRNPLIIKTGDNAFISILSFGAIIFWNTKADEHADLLKTITEISQTAVDQRVRDQLWVDPTAGKDEPLFNEVLLADASADRIYLVSFAFAQSVVLERVELDVELILKNLEPLLIDLKEDGHIKAASKTLLQTIGFSMSSQQELMSGLLLLDRPAETWESESLSRLYERLYDYFDIATRQAALEQKVDFIKSSVSVLMDIVNARHSVRLEWIVIILIALEVIPGMYHIAQEFHLIP